MKMLHNTTYDLNDTELVSALDELSLWSAPFALRLLDKIEYKPGIKALDIGFGTGFPLIELAMRLGSSSVVHGIDPWQAATNRAAQKIAAYAVGNITITEGIAEKLPYHNEFFDLIVSNNGINNVSDIRQTFSECYRAMKKVGQFVFSMNLRYTMNEFYDVFREALAAKGMSDKTGDIERHIYSKRKPVAEIEKLLSESGFVIKNIFHDSFNFRYADGTAFLNHYFIRLAFLPEWMKIVPTEKSTEVWEAIENRLNEIANKNKGLKLTVPFAVFDCKKKE
jgi:ubiquinone/menaquinone biosynthesis C-methylase UbiE